MSRLERSLRELGAEIAWPATPGLELDLERVPRRPAWLRPLVLGLAVALAVSAAVLALSPGARSALLHLFHLRGATVELVETLPPVDVQQPDLGERVSRAEAERRAGFRLLDLPQEPDAIFARGGTVSLVYGDPERPRLVLTELRGGVFEGWVKKAAAGGTTIDEVDVGGEPGLYISGDEHYVMFRDANGDIADERTFLAGTVLLWNRGELLLRLEGDLTRGEALALARGVR